VERQAEGDAEKGKTGPTEKKVSLAGEKSEASCPESGNKGGTGMTISVNLSISSSKRIHCTKIGNSRA